MNNTMKKKRRKKFDFEGMLCDTFRIQLPLDYDNMQNKKLRIWNCQQNKFYDFSFSSRHKNKLTLDTFLKLLRQNDIIT